MPVTQIEDDDDVILVEWSVRPGTENVGIFDRKSKENAKKSSKALDTAMSTIKKMAKRIKKLNDSVPIEFSQIEIDFGIALDYEVGAVLASTTTKASINVKLTWDRKEPKKSQIKKPAKK
jgi:hypothetical protein